jgi:RimJ/RimL family protein N-acetyltransferase
MGDGSTTIQSPRLRLTPTAYDDDCVTRWDIIDAATAETVGTIGFFGREDPDTIVVGYEIDNGWRGSGIGTEALTALLQHIADAQLAGTVVAETEIDHAASRRVMEKADMTVADIDGQRVRYVYACPLAVRSAP